MNGYQIKYGRGRFPVRPKREDGTFGCRGCGGFIPKNRKTWCSLGCKKQFDPGYVIAAVRQRDKGVCTRCGFDTEKAETDYSRKMWEAKESGKYWSDEWRNQNRRPPIAEYDHIIPFSEGGLTVLENMQTICSLCHKKKTKEWHATRKGQQLLGLKL